ncbi:MAG: SDR family NAD(P)-dependent oxidoreductase [Acidobacteria bacterium]|nr:SDR family NAD(P)-dependent oxidoreductase [Acidobacteriota bacterium]
MGILDGKVAIITGAGSGLGRAYAQQYADEGANVLVNDLNAEAAAETVSEIQGSGGTAETNVCSVSDFDAAEAMIAQAIDTWGDLDILVNNAGILRDAMSFSMTEEDFDAVINVHIKGHWAPSRHAAVHWRNQAKAGEEKPRRLISTASESGLFGGPAQSNYSAAKGGICSMAITFARELEKYGVTSNVIVPRARTGLTDYLPSMAVPDDPDAFDRYDPANVAPFVTWLASDASAHINGQTFIVALDGMWLAKRWHVVAEYRGDGRLEIDEVASNVDSLFAAEESGIPPFDPPGYGPRSGAKSR